MNHNAVLELRLTKSYPGFNLKVEATFPPGVTAVFGPSGSGKTTVLNCIAGLDNPDQGEIILEGTPLFSSSRKLNLKPEKRRLGYVFQDGLLFPHQTVGANIRYGFDMTPTDRRKVQPEKLVDLLELGPLLDRRPANLSAGERQRVALARAVATSPQLLLMDEPLGSLDMGLRGKILRYLKGMRREFGIPIVYVSHSISEVLAIADRALVISGGKQLAFAEPRKVILEPFVHSVIDTGGLENLLDVELVHETGEGLAGAKLGDSLLWLPTVPQDIAIGDTISIAVRAGDIIIAVDEPSRISARNLLRARIDGLHRIGNKVVVYADVGVLLVVEITSEALDSLALSEGQEVFLVMKSSSIIVLN